MLVETEKVKIEFTIADRNWAKLESEIEKINKKGRKCGQPPIKITILNKHLEKMLIRDPYHLGPEQPAPLIWNGAYETFRDIRIDGQIPYIQDWQFVASLEHTEYGNIIRTIIEGINLEQYRTRQVCDHCGTERRRNDSFILRYKDGTTKQVGRQCLKLFFPGTDPLAIATWLEWLMALETIAVGGEIDDDEDFQSRSRVEMYSVLEVMALSAACIRLYGYMSRKKADEKGGEFGGPTTTASRIFSYYNPGKESKPSDFIKNKLPIDEQRAQEAINWVKSKKIVTDYDHNVNLYTQMEYTDGRGIGIVASAVAMFMKVEDQLAQEKKKAEALDLKHVGTIGKRQSFKAKFIHEHSYEGDFGPGHIFTFEDEHHNILKTFTSSDLFKTDWYQFPMRDRSKLIGKWFDLKGTVSAHSEYKSIPETILKRCAIPIISHRESPEYELELCGCPDCEEVRFPPVKAKIQELGSLFAYYVDYRKANEYSWNEGYQERAERNFQYHMTMFNFKDDGTMSDKDIRALLKALYVRY